MVNISSFKTCDFKDSLCTSVLLEEQEQNIKTTILAIIIIFLYIVLFIKATLTDKFWWFSFKVA